MDPFPSSGNRPWRAEEAAQGQQALSKTHRQHQVPGLAEAGAAAEMPPTIHSGVPTLVPLVETEAQGQKGLAWVTQEWPRVPSFLLRRAGLGSIRGGRAEGLQGPNPSGKALTWVLGWPSGHEEEVGATLGPAPFEPLAQPLAAVNDYPAACQYRSQVQFEGHQTLDCARAGWGSSRKHQPGPHLPLLVASRSQPSKPCSPVTAWPTAPRDRGQ